MSDYNQLKNAAILTPSTNTDLGSDTNRYSNVFMSGNIVMSNGVTVTSTNVITPKVAAISYVGDDTATSIAGGQTVTLTGTGFALGAAIVVNTTPASSVSFVSGTQLTFVAPAMSAGTYILYVINPDGGTATFFTGISYSGTPTWTNSAGSLGSPNTGASVSITVAATGDAPVTYIVKSGSSLPNGLSLNSTTGVISGTMPSPTSSTTYNFTLTAIDAQNQDTDRAFSLTAVTAAAPSVVDALVVAGGGGGGTWGGGGGGAGGYRTLTGFSVTSGNTITITVGSGGTGGTSGNGTKGSDSVLAGTSTITSTGGGYGGTYGGGGSTSGGSGGSGGGGGAGGGSQGSSGGAGNTPPTSPVQGYRGGNNWAQDSVGSPGGGGGASQAGANAAPNTGGKGGDGSSSSITGTSVTYAGGGGACGLTAGTGGGGGGGAGGTGNSGIGTAGTVNTGGGGGGTNPQGNNGGIGGSGVVIIRYADTYTSASSTTGSPTITTTGGYRTYKFTTSGTVTF